MTSSRTTGSESCWLGMRRYAKAEASSCEAIRVSPGYPDAHNNLGNALRNQGRPDQALVSFREALRLRPEYPEAYNNVGIVLKHLGKFNEAVASYEQALRLRSNYPEAHNNLGLALCIRGKHEAAVVGCLQAVRLKPDYVEGYANRQASLAMGKIPQHRGRLQASHFAPFQRSRTQEPGKRSVPGWTNSGRRKLATVLRSELSPNYIDALNDLGITLAAAESV